MKWILLLQLLAASVDTGTTRVSATVNTLTTNTLVRTRPLEVTRVLVSLGSQCIMFMYEDSSMVMRTDTYSDSVCVRYYNKFPAKYRKNVGYWQKRTDMICVLQDGMGRDPKCNSSLITSTFESFSQGWSKCTPYVMACGALTTVFDFDETSKEKYENGVCWLGDRYGIGENILNPYDCYWSGFVYPLREFPGRWETADNFIFFYRSP